MAAVVFDYAEWAAQYPALAVFTDETAATLFFRLATQFCANDDCALVPYDLAASPQITTRKDFLYLLVSHIAELGSPARGGLTGRISTATQGSVSVATELKMSDKAAWYTQTQWGALYWQLTTIYRMGVYIPGPQPFIHPRTGLV